MFTRPSRFFSLFFITALGMQMAAAPVQAEPLKAACALPGPTLTYPANPSTINTLVPTFQWNGTGTDAYFIQLSTANDFSNLVINYYVSYASGAMVSFPWRDNLVSATTYYWHVASVCSGSGLGAYSSTATFQTGSITGPFIQPPAMKTPADGAIFLLHATVNYSWENSATALAYQVRVYNSLDHAQNDQEDSLFWGTTWRTNAQDILTETGTYYWRIKVRDGTAWSPLSPIRSYSVINPVKIFLPLIIRN